MSDIGLPGMELFLFVMALGALFVVGLVTSLGVFAWASVAKRPLARRRSGVAAAMFAAAAICAAGALVVLD
jgi:hypothetical protein